MITTTSLKHNSIQQRLNKTMQVAVKHPNCPIALYNKRWELSMVCHYLTGEIAYSKLGKSSGFFWWEYQSMRDITKIVESSLRAC